MRYAWIAPLVIAAACAAPPPPRPDVHVDVTPSGSSAFRVLDAGKEPETRRYRIQAGELLASSAAAQFDGRPADGRLIVPEPDSIERLTTAALADAASAIKTFVAPETWEADGQRALYVEKDELVVRHSPAVLAQVERLIDTLKANRDTQLRLSVSYVSIPADELVILRYLPALREGLGGLIHRKALADLKALQADSRITLSGAPRMTLFHGQRGVISIGSRFAYIKSVDIKEDGYAPKVDVVTAGMDLQVRAVRNGPDSDRYLLEAAANVQDLASMTSLRLADHPIQFPVMIGSRSGGAFVVGPDEAAVLVTPHVRISNGILGSLGAQPSRRDRINLIVIEVDRVE